MKVLVVEDDPNTLAGLVDILETEGYETLAAGNGEEALKVFERESPDFICLDIMMPGMSGYDVCQRIREINSSVPIIFISAKSEEIDRVLGFELGADDFIPKPFGTKEVIARIRAVSRRCLAARNEYPMPASFKLRDLEVFPRELRARRGDKVIDLSLREVRILELFYKNKGNVLDRETIFQHCWGMKYFPSSRTLDQHISQLRKRIELNPREPQIIQTVHGVGYRYNG